MVRTAIGLRAAAAADAAARTRGEEVEEEEEKQEEPGQSLVTFRSTAAAMLSAA